MVNEAYTTSLGGFEVLAITTTLLLVASALLLFIKNNRLGRYLSIVGFGLLAPLLCWIAFGYLTTGGTEEQLWAIVAIAAAGVSLKALVLHRREWQRAQQVTGITAVTMAILVPFEVYPVLGLMLQEWIAYNLSHLLAWVGVSATIEPSAATGGMYRLGFENGSNIAITRGCTGIDPFALFSGFVLAVRTTLVNRLLGLLFVIVAVVVVNTIRLVFVATSMAGDWFGPLISNSNTIEITYIVAEVIVGQGFVILAAIGALAFLCRLIPDLKSFLQEFVIIVRGRSQSS